MDTTAEIQSNARDAIAQLEGILRGDVSDQQIWHSTRDAGVRIERIKSLLTQSGFRTSE